MIKKNDGTPYRPTGTLQQFDPNGPKQDLFNKYSAEVIRVFGSPIYYFEIFINFQSIDKLYLESRDKIWSQFPVELFTVYEPVQSQNPSGLFGIDSIDQIMFEFNYQDVLNRLGHPPKIGARLFTPHRNENWVVVDRILSGFQYWGQNTLQLFCQKFQESSTTGEGRVTQPEVS